MDELSFTKKYDKELQGQIEFLQKYLPRVDRSLDISDVQKYYSDGVVRGNLLEFKTQIENLNVVLSQTIKLLSSMRLKGRPLPANIILISLNDTTAYIYHSEDYLEKIEKIKRAIPDIALSTDVIVGFPTETNEDFNELIELAKRIKKEFSSLDITSCI